MLSMDSVMDSGRVDGYKVGFAVSVVAEKDEPDSFQERDGVSKGVRVFKTHGRGKLHGMGRVVCDGDFLHKGT